MSHALKGEHFARETHQEEEESDVRVSSLRDSCVGHSVDSDAELIVAVSRAELSKW